MASMTGNTVLEPSTVTVLVWAIAAGAKTTPSVAALIKQ